MKGHQVASNLTCFVIHDLSLDDVSLNVVYDFQRMFFWSTIQSQSVFKSTSGFSKNYHKFTMSSSEEPTPDLASILRTLAALRPQNQQAQVEATPQAQNNEYAPAGAVPYQLQLQNYQQPPAHAWARHEETTHSRSTTPPGFPKNHVDPATIIDWSGGLRCVMKVVAKNENIVEEIKRVSFSLVRSNIILMFFR